MFCIPKPEHIISVAATIKRLQFHHRRRKRTTLLDLPNEILHEIALNLAPNIVAMNALSRTSFLLSQLVTPILYNHATTALGSRRTSPLRAMCTLGMIHSVRSLLAHGVPAGTLERGSGTTALQAAIMLNESAIVEVMLLAGVCVNQPDENGWTPLHWAVMSGEVHIAHTLLAHGALTDVRGRFGGGATALHFAVGGRGMGVPETGMVRLLLEWGAAVGVGDDYGMTPMQYGLVVGDEESVGLMMMAPGHRQRVGGRPAAPVQAINSEMIEQQIEIRRAWWKVSVLEERMSRGRRV